MQRSYLGPCANSPSPPVIRSCYLLLFLGFLVPLHARTWTSTDGKKLQADFVSADETSVTIKRKKDGREFTLPLSKLSAKDQAFVKKKREEASNAPAPREAPESDHGKYKDLFKNKWVKGEHDGLKFQMQAPSRASARKPLPVVVYLHGSLECGDDNEKQINVAPSKSFAVRFFKKRPCIVIAPQTPLGTDWAGASGTRVISLIDDLLKEAGAADPKRVYLTGYSLGAYGTWHLLGKRPDLFAAAVPAAGGGDPSIAPKLKGIDIWVFHGKDDDVVPVSEAQKMVNALKEAGVPVEYDEMNARHNIPGKVFFQEKVHEWLFKQKRED